MGLLVLCMALGLTSCNKDNATIDVPENQNLESQYVFYTKADGSVYCANQNFMKKITDLPIANESFLFNNGTLFYLTDDAKKSLYRYNMSKQKEATLVAENVSDYIPSKDSKQALCSTSDGVYLVTEKGKKLLMNDEVSLRFATPDCSAFLYGYESKGTLGLYRDGKATVLTDLMGRVVYVDENLETIYYLVITKVSSTKLVEEYSLYVKRANSDPEKIGDHIPEGYFSTVCAYEDGTMYYQTQATTGDAADYCFYYYDGKKSIKLKENRSPLVALEEGKYAFFLDDSKGQVCVFAGKELIDTPAGIGEIFYDRQTQQLVFNKRQNEDKVSCLAKVQDGKMHILKTFAISTTRPSFADGHIVDTIAIHDEETGGPTNALYIDGEYVEDNLVLSKDDEYNMGDGYYYYCTLNDKNGIKGYTINLHRIRPGTTTVEIVADNIYDFVFLPTATAYFDVRQGGGHMYIIAGDEKTEIDTGVSSLLKVPSRRDYFFERIHLLMTSTMFWR